MACEGVTPHEWGGASNMKKDTRDLGQLSLPPSPCFFSHCSLCSSLCTATLPTLLTHLSRCMPHCLQSCLYSFFCVTLNCRPVAAWRAALAAAASQNIFVKDAMNIAIDGYRVVGDVGGEKPGTQTLTRTSFPPWRWPRKTGPKHYISAGWARHLPGRAANARSYRSGAHISPVSL